uniref:Cadherin domain-containing protein n=1 Tax=Leptobrachium leishanense TaxID=445787 RepID=A0A8C5MH00_9ANUR
MLLQKMPGISQCKNTLRTMTWQVIAFSISLFCEIACGQVQYSILEEIKSGYIVGNVAKDLGLESKDLAERRLQVVSSSNKHYFNISLENGNLYVTDRIDREALCEMEDTCLLNLEVLAEKPVNIFHVKIYVKDVNDNYPIFLKPIYNITMSESALPGTHFALENAQDADLGSNSIQSYNLSPNQHFKLGEKITTQGIKFPELVLERALDREKQGFYDLILTAFDGGETAKTGTALLKIFVQDINDNFPVFTLDTYWINLNEDAPVGFLVCRLNATDKDEGGNGELTYSFSRIPEKALKIFSIDAKSGEIKVKGALDFEVTRNYEMTVEAKDGGGLVTHCTVLIQIADVNDNAPEIMIKSLIQPIPENSLPGTLIALFNVNDQDSGSNGEVSCHLPEKLPFKLISSSNNYYQLISTSLLDRETTPMYNITITAEDEGSPPMSSKKTIHLLLSDVNDNPPIFQKPSYIVYIPENNTPGSSIHRVQASDIDDGKNSELEYSLVSSNISNIPISSYVSINVKSGVIYSQRSFDYEELREFQFQVVAKDRGQLSLNNNVTVRICIIDMNDNAPKILYPSAETESTNIFEFIPRSSEKGYLVSKVIAVDADSGHNAWLSYHLLEIPDTSLFVIGQHTGEIKIGRDLQDMDSIRQKVVVLVKDNGIPSLSVTVTLNLVMAENFQEVLPEIVIQPKEPGPSSKVTFFLVVSIAVISFLFIVTVIVTIISKCRKTNSQTALGAFNRSWYPQLSLNYPSQFSDGSLPLPYSYDVCVTLDSTQNEIAYLKPIQNVPTENLIDTSDSATGDSTQDNSAPDNRNQADTKEQEENQPYVNFSCNLD